MVEVSRSFSKEIKSYLGGETISHCYQCGTCTGSCPISRKISRFNPRRIILQSIRGYKEKVIPSDEIWLCSSCFNCQERCPQGVEIAEVIYALRNIAIREGRVPRIYSEFISAMYNEGKLVKVTSFTLKKREAYGLPPLKETDLEAVRGILNETTFGEIVKSLEVKK